MTPLISVVIPVYNRTWELQRALDSLVQQSETNFEVIVCDDGSKEDIRAVVQPYLEKLNLKYFRIENSGGPARPRNVAVSHATGEWIAFLDSDDWWDAQRLAVVNAALDEDADLIYHRLRVVRAPGLKNPRERRQVIGESLHGDALHHMFLFGNPVPNSAAVIRRSFLQKIGGVSEQKNLITLEDFDTWLRLIEAGGRIRFLNQVLGSYWVGEDAISAVSKAQIENNLVFFIRHSASVREDFRAGALASHQYRIGSMLFKLGEDMVAARACLKKAVQLPTAELRLKRMLMLLMTYLWKSDRGKERR